MSKDKFIELINLYIDGEINPSESVLLETEVANNSEYRKIYNQYCRIHRASCLLGEQFKETISVSQERDPVVQIRKSSSWAYRFRKISYPLGGIAAALIVAVTVPSMLRNDQSGIEDPSTPEVSQALPSVEPTETPIVSSQSVPGAESIVAVNTNTENGQMVVPILPQVVVLSNDSSPDVSTPIAKDFSEQAVVSLDLPRKAYFISANWEPEIKLSNSASPFNPASLSKPQGWSFLPVGNTLMRPRSLQLKPSPFTNGTPIYRDETGQVMYDDLGRISFQFQK